MILYQDKLVVETAGRGTVEITAEITSIIATSSIYSGMMQLFLQHTSASLIITENADATVRQDLEMLFSRWVPDGDRAYQHDYEGSDDMSAHARSVLTSNHLSVPVVEGKLGLGTWQGIFLWEHRKSAFERSMIVTIQGEVL